MGVPIQIHDKQFSLFIPSDFILNEVESLANRLELDYEEKNPIFLVVLNGAFMFAADLLKFYNKNCDISFIKLSSYKGFESTGTVNQQMELLIDVKDRHVIIVEDIVDTGLTIESLTRNLKKLNPASIEICSLLFKPEAFKGTIPPKYQGFVIANKFVLGYGLDYNERGRNLKDLYQLKEN
ncbi:MAG: hypoxanthine phosphoribosyltransferase [Bacteroidota bacterium]